MIDLDKFQRIYKSFKGGFNRVDEFDPNEYDSLIEEDIPEGFDIIERYWVNAPYAYVSILRDDVEDDLLYHITTPTLDSFERELLDNLRDDTRSRLLYGDPDESSRSDMVLKRLAMDALNQYGLQIDVETFYRVFYYLHREFSGYGEIQPILNDQHVEDISCSGNNVPLFVYHDKYDDIKSNLAFEQDALERLLIKLAQMSGRQLSIGDPITNATLPDGSRAELVYTDEVSARGSAFTIRQYSEETMTPVDLINYGTFSVEQMAYLWLAIENNRNLIFAGGTASGKTTSLNAVSMFIPPRSKVITIEDTREISLAHENWLSNTTREETGSNQPIDMFELLRSALRHRPEYIIVGEIRGEEAGSLFQAMNTGHTTYSTMHADSMQTVINRLENDPINVPRAMIQSLDILSIQNLTRLNDQRVRRSDEIVEVQDIDQRTGELNYSTQFSWEAKHDEFAGDTSDSELLEEVMASQGWSRRELLRELNNRQRVLRYLIDEDVTRYDRFTSVINRYARNPDAVLETVDEELQTDAPTQPTD